MNADDLCWARDNRDHAATVHETCVCKLDKDHEKEHECFCGRLWYPKPEVCKQDITAQLINSSCGKCGHPILLHPVAEGFRCGRCELDLLIWERRYAAV